MKQTLVSVVLLTFVLILGCGPTGDPSKSADANDSEPLPLSAGKSLFSTHCVVCHGTDGGLGLNEAGDLRESEMTLEQRKQIIRDGKGTMIAYRRILDDREIDAVARYTKELQREKEEDE